MQNRDENKLKKINLQNTQAGSLFRFDSCLTLQNSFFFSFDIVFLLNRFRFFSLSFVFLLYRFRRFFSLDFVFCPEIALNYFFEKLWFYTKYIVKNRR
jgi:hypothetical protein